MKVGFVNIIGRPNVGKSSLLNFILDYKLAIISDKPQTTRNQFKGIYNSPEGQIIFQDTPGIHKPKKILGEFLNKEATQHLKETDLVIFLTPADEKIGPGDRKIIEMILPIKNKLAIITKTDLVSNYDLLSEKATYLKKHEFLTVVNCSIKDPTFRKVIIETIFEFLNEGVPFYNSEELTDLPTIFLVKEFIREAAINNVYDEIPHSIGVVVKEFDIEEKLIKISSVIYVEKNSQKGILIGKEGKKIREIGKAARVEIEALVNKKVYLDLKVKINKNWTKDSKQIKLVVSP